MEQQIFQCYASEPMEEHFASGLRKRWNLTPYHDTNAPTVMFGWYDHKNDEQFLKNHKGPLVIIWGGADLNRHRAHHLNSRPNTYQIAYGWVSNLLKSWNVNHKIAIIPIKSFKNFQPLPLGNKIYVYKGWKVNRGGYFKWNEIIQPLINEWGEENFIFGMGHDINYVYENYYKNCFVFIKPNERGGSTTMWELGHMGRKTIAQNQGGAPNVLEFKDINHIAELVNEEAKKIGTVQKDLSDQVYNWMINDNRWLNLNWWENVK